MSDYERDTDRAAQDVFRRVAAGERLSLKLAQDVIAEQRGTGTRPRPVVVLWLATSWLSGEAKARRAAPATR